MAQADEVPGPSVDNDDLWDTLYNLGLAAIHRIPVAWLVFLAFFALTVYAIVGIAPTAIREWRLDREGQRRHQREHEKVKYHIEEMRNRSRRSKDRRRKR